MTLTFGTHKALIKLTASTNFYIINYNSFWKIHCFTFSPYKSIGDQMLTCRKKKVKVNPGASFEQTW